MIMTTMSSKFQIVIPKDVREKLHLSPRQRLYVVAKGWDHYPGAGSPPEITQRYAQGDVPDRSSGEEGPIVKRENGPKVFF